MISPYEQCRLFETDGTPLTQGQVQVHDRLGAEAIVTQLDNPGRVVQRCLIAGVRQIVVRINDTALIPARIERVSFDAKQGRTCVLRLT